MKTKFVFASLTATLCGLAAIANSAKAETDFNLRVNVGLARPPAVFVSEHDRDRDGDFREHSAPHGYWKEIVVRTWIPSRWVVRCDRRGHEIRFFERAHIDCRTDRVWIEFGRDHNHDSYARR